MKTILAPIDFSSVSNRIAEEAIHLAKLIRGRVMLLHVVPLPSAVRDILPVVDDVGSALTAQKIAANGRLAVWKRELQKGYSKVDTMLLTGSPAAVILDQAEKLNVPYIVMGSRCHSAIHDVLTGSTASGVLKKARYPVLLVPPVELTASGAEHHVEASAVAQTH